MTCIKQDPVLYVSIKIDEDQFDADYEEAVKWYEAGGPELTYPLTIGSRASLFPTVTYEAWQEARAFDYEEVSHSPDIVVKITSGTVEQYKEYVAKLTDALAPLAKWVTVEQLKEES